MEPTEAEKAGFSIGFVLAIFYISVMFSQKGQRVFAESGNPLKQTKGPTDVQRLEGRWIRPDGGYILELREIKKDVA